ncbi:hypothetical protein GX50_05498 [[Emmonsia] crescens]|uniref:PPPDE domain-containing protein n=1 Tax=[Emmonsia] crescens TaxID=73230 RepID=A0A2B7ZEU7_9EURO|nr:hypothetical protein GX50_05498 [Emmonsia crescens]
MGSVYVAVYQPDGQTLGTHHWALCLETLTETTIFQIVGQSNSFKYDELTAKPDNSRRHLQNVDVANVDDADRFRQVVRAQRIDNDMYHWGCEQWVMDVLGSLIEEDVISDCYHFLKSPLPVRLRTTFLPHIFIPPSLLAFHLV